MQPFFSYFLGVEPEEPNPCGGGLNAPEQKKCTEKESKKAIVVLFLSFCLLFYFLGYFLFMPPENFNDRDIIEVKSGMGIGEVGSLLAEKNIIRSPFFFKVTVWLYGGKNGVIAGKYKFDEAISVFGVASRMTTNGYGATVLKITIPEGLSNRQIASLLSRNLNNFDSDKFISLAKDKEGYLFPDTYFFEPETGPEKIIEMMSDNFKEKIKKVDMKIIFSGKKLHDVLTMASILEEEARTEETRKMISDILWRRIKDGRPLQVDASFVYLLGKGSANLSLDDMKIDSPYNTYTHKGLPPGPITNPGLDAILAALDPISNSYWFYLSDDDGNMHYAKTFEEHKANKAKYLK